MLILPPLQNLLPASWDALNPCLLCEKISLGGLWCDGAPPLRLVTTLGPPSYPEANN